MQLLERGIVNHLTESVDRVSQPTPTDGRTDGLTKKVVLTVKKLHRRYAHAHITRFQSKVLAPPLAFLADAAWLAHKDEAAGFIRAIKTLRGWTGMGLHDAKEAIRSASERLGGVG
jgi:hypothetical protein